MKKFRVWHYQNCNTFYKEVKTVLEGVRQIKSKIESDLRRSWVTDNAFGLEVYDKKLGEWIEWYSINGNSVLEQYNL